MKRITALFIFPVLVLLYAGCKEDEIDEEDPVIDLSIVGAFPTNCDTLYFGETFTFKALFSDNAELGSTTAFSIDIHNNFDHHSHSTEVTECTLDDIKDPVNPYVFIENYDIPKGLSEYETNIDITLPDGDSEGSFDTGDYHFFISLADKEGWSAQKGLSLKILRK